MESLVKRYRLPVMSKFRGPNVQRVTMVGTTASYARELLGE